jgi:hypothetical protein
MSEKLLTRDGEPILSWMAYENMPPHIKAMWVVLYASLTQPGIAEADQVVELVEPLEYVSVPFTIDPGNEVKP